LQTIFLIYKIKFAHTRVIGLAIKSANCFQ